MSGINTVKGLFRILAFGVSGLLLAGCVPETSSPNIRPAEGVSAERALEEFLLVLVTADIIADQCQAYGIRKNYDSSDQVIDRYATTLQNEGYSEPELRQAMQRLSVDAVAKKGFARMRAKGVRDGDVGSLCQFGKNEIASDTAIGRLLRIDA